MIVFFLTEKQSLKNIYVNQKNWLLKFRLDILN